MVIKKNHSLKKLNTFGLSTNAERFMEIHSVADLQLVLKTNFSPIHILGGGSNLLLTDNLKGIVLKNEIKGIIKMAETEEEVVVAVGGGEVWHEFVLWTLEKNWGGVENLSLIPGSVGAAPIQNIGAYGVEIVDVFQQLEAVELATGKVKLFNKEDCQFGYRDSIFKNELKGKYFISKVIFRLSKFPKINTSYGAIKELLKNNNIENPTIKDVSNAVIEIRQSKLPDPKEIGNSGSFFKNPEIEPSHFIPLKEKYPDIVFYEMPDRKIKIPAGWLIEKAGWKGKRIGDAGCHAKQALVLVNYGNATGIEIRNLANKIQVDILEKFNIGLTPEVNFW
ncbi:MAG: UDP-N-acetylmuramate dehydrogenase [Saprospiraceae bacterium]